MSRLAAGGSRRHAGTTSHQPPATSHCRELLQPVLRGDQLRDDGLDGRSRWPRRGPCRGSSTSRSRNPPPRWFAAPPSGRPLRLDVPSALATRHDLAGRRVDHARGDRPPSPCPSSCRRRRRRTCRRPTRRAPIFIPLSSIPNLVIEPTMMYFTPSALPILATCAADGSARSLFEKFCSARMSVEALALDDAVAAVLHEAVDDEVGDALADVLVAPPAVDGAVIEVDAGPRSAACSGRTPARAPPGRTPPGPPTPTPRHGIFACCPPVEAAIRSYTSLLYIGRQTVVMSANDERRCDATRRVVKIGPSWRSRRESVSSNRGPSHAGHRERVAARHRDDVRGVRAHDREHAEGHARAWPTPR